MGGTWRDRFGRLFDIQGLFWQVAIALALLIVGALGIGTIVFWESVRDGVSDFLTADVEVWHLLLIVGIAAIVAFVAWWFLRRSGSAQERVSRARFAPREIPKYDVYWPITAIRGSYDLEFQAGRPTCPKCRTPLGLDFGEGKEPFSLLAHWKSMSIEEMEFRCPKDGLAYDLTKYKIPMSIMTKNAEDLALGEYQTALREAGQ